MGFIRGGAWLGSARLSPASRERPSLTPHPVCLSLLGLSTSPERATLMHHLLFSSAERVETQQYQMLVEQCSAASVAQREYPCIKVTRELSLGTRWGNPQLPRPRPRAELKPKNPHPFLESLAPPPQRDASENRVRWEIVEQLTTVVVAIIVLAFAMRATIVLATSTWCRHYGRHDGPERVGGGRGGQRRRFDIGRSGSSRLHSGGNPSVRGDTGPGMSRGKAANNDVTTPWRGSV